MSDDELVALMERAMRAHEQQAPAPHVPRLQPPPEHQPQRRTWMVVLSAACVLVVIGGLGYLGVHRQGRRPVPPAAGGPAAHTTVTVFIARGTPIPHADVISPFIGLMARRTEATLTSNRGTAAARALTQFAPSRMHVGKHYVALNPWWHSGVHVLDVRNTAGVIRVKLDRKPAEPRLNANAEQALQQMAWTVSTALKSQDPVQVLVQGHPLLRLWGLPVHESAPDPGALTRQAQQTPWYRLACGPRRIVARVAGRSVPLQRHTTGATPVSVRVGDTIAFAVRGGCFRSLRPFTDGTSVLRTRGDRLVAAQAGTADGGLGGDLCGNSFTETDLCPFAPAAQLRVTVLPRTT